MKNRTHSKHIFILVSVLIIVSIFAVVFLERERFGLNFSEVEYTTIYGVYLGNVPIWAEVVDTQVRRRIGLSGYESLKEGQGMLFIFDTEDRHGIWMKDMNFPIDIVWIDEKLNIVDIRSNATPESYPEVFRPAQKSLYVVETVAGLLNANNIKIGQKVILKIF